MSLLPPITDPEQVFTRVLGQPRKPAQRMMIETAVILETARSIKRAHPEIDHMHLVGSRLRRKVGRDLDFVAVVRRGHEVPIRNTALRVGGLKVNLFFSKFEEMETHILEFGLGMDIVRWKKAAKRKGLKLNRFGLWKGSVIVSRRMKEIAAILGMELKPFLVESLRNRL